METNASGAKVWTAKYDPFGNVHATTATPAAIRFPGQWFQSESGLHQNWMRDYDPTTGRYLQSDPLGLIDGASVYGYALQNPGRWVDPRGEAIGEGIIGGIIGGIEVGGAIVGGAIAGAIAIIIYPTAVADGTLPASMVPTVGGQCEKEPRDCYSEYEERNNECRRMFPRIDLDRRQRQQCWKESANELARCQREHF